MVLQSPYKSLQFSLPLADSNNTSYMPCGLYHWIFADGICSLTA
uniref:Uncharacterized protein n=1 Tax=Aegilops tauschii subsp. strangulata TaxID=200361 RepID=A0A453FGE1_AEGTS